MNRYQLLDPVEWRFDLRRVLIHWIALVASLLHLAACASLSDVGPIRGLANVKEFFPQEPYLTAARLAGRGDDAGALEAWIDSTKLDVNHLGQAARVPWSIQPAGQAPTLLIWATMHNNIEAAQVLLNAGASPERVANPEDPRPLHYAVWAKDDRLMKLLLQRGADPGAITRRPGNYPTPLMMLLETELGNNAKLLDQGMSEAEGRRRAELLLASGADINQGYYRPKAYRPDDLRAVRALNEYAVLNQWNKVQWLLEHGADFRLPETGDPPRYITCTLRLYLKEVTRRPFEPREGDGQVMGVPVRGDFARAVNYMAARGFPMDDLKLERKLPGCPH